MPLIKKRDVPSYFAARRRARTHPCSPISQPDATGFSEPEPGASPANPSEFRKDFLAEHSSAPKPIAPSADEGLGAL